MIVTATERDLYKRCRRKWDYGSLNRQGLQRIVAPQALSLGTLVHESLEGWLQHPDTDILDHFYTASTQMLEASKRNYADKIGLAISDEELQPIYDSIDLGRYMVTNYANHWKAPLGSKFRLFSTEQKITVPIPNTEHLLECKFDGIISDDKDRLYILEHKTYNSRPTDISLRSNAQFLTYIWALTQMYDSSIVAGLAYDGIWKRPSPPKGKKLEDMFIRHLLIRAPEELEENAHFLAMEVNEMANPELSIYVNRRWEGCYDCQYDILCLSQSRGEDIEYVRRTMFCLRERDEYDKED